MTLNELRYIVAVAEHRHFRKAARSCNISQPTLSVAIRKFEEENGITLFERRNKDILITPIGERIVEIARDILNRTDEIRQLARASQDSLQTELRLGAIYTIGPYLLPTFIHQLRQHHPTLPLLVEEAYTADLLQKLNNGQLDLAIASLPIEDPHLHIAPLYREPFVAALAKDHPLRNETHITTEHLKQENILILGAGHCFRDQVIEAYPFLLRHDNTLQRTLEGSSLETLLYMVASGVGMTILPCTAVRSVNEDIIIRPLAPPVPERTVALLWRRSFPRKKALKAVLDTLKNIHLPCTLPCTDETDFFQDAPEETKEKKDTDS